MEYKRLTERCVADKDSIYIDGTEYIRRHGTYGECVSRLAELEDKIEQGTLVELPCKVGDVVYLVFEERWSVGKKETHWYIRKTKLTYGNMERVIKEYGEFVFLTREEAEKRLEELKK